MEKCKTEKLKTTRKKLAKRFIDLKDFFANDCIICRECVLSAFSLYPTEESFLDVEQMAIASGKLKPENDVESNDKRIEPLDTGQNKNWNCPLHAPYDESLKTDDQVVDLCSRCGSFRIRASNSIDCSMDSILSITGNSLTTHNNYDAMRAPNFVLDSLKQHIPLKLCEDLLAVIGAVRCKTLTWLHEWPELHKACYNYLYYKEGTYKSDIGLNFLNIDYELFKDWPEAEKLTFDNCIEKGYEMYAESSSGDQSQSTKFIEDTNTPVLKEEKTTKKRKKSQKSEETSSSFDNLRSAEDIKNNVLSNEGLSQEKSQTNSKLNNSKTAKEVSANTFNNYFVESKENKNISDDAKQSAKCSADVIGDIKMSDFSNLTSILTAEKKSSDPNVLQSLRKYRPNMKSKAIKNLQVNEPNTVQCANGNAPALNELNLSPRVILNRFVDESENNESENNVSEKELSPKSVKSNILNINCNRENIDADGKNDLSRTNNCNILSGIPGLSSFDMLIPDKVQPIVQIVQLVHNTNKQPMSPPKVSRSSSQSNIALTPSTPSTSSEMNRVSVVDSPSSQSESLSTPVTPHIQRVGQATLNCDTVSGSASSAQSNSQSSLTSNTTLPDLVPASQSLDNTSTDSIPSSSMSQQNIISNTSQSSRLKISNSTLTNLLTNRIVMTTKPGNQNLKSNPTIINVLSQKILRPPYSTANITNCGSVVSATQSVPHSIPNTLVTSSNIQTSINSQTSNQNITTTPQSQQHLLQLLNQSQKAGGSQLIKGVNLISGVPDSKMVQFICKTDGKTFQLTPFSANTTNLRIQQVDNRVFKSVPPTQVRSADVGTGISTRSVYEENYAKFIQTANKISHIQNASKQSNTITTTSTVSSNQNTSLPKFNQAFGKTAYHSGTDVNENDSSTTSTNVTVTNLPVIKTYKSDSDDATIMNTVVQNAINPVIIKRSQLPNSTSTVTTLAGTTSRTAMTPLSVQTVHGGVIYTRQIPISTGNLLNANLNRSPVKLPQSSADTTTVQTVVPVAISSPVVVSKGSVVRNKVNNLLTATFSSPVVSSSMDNTAGTSFNNQTQAETSDGSSATETTRPNLQQPLYALQTSLPIKLTVPSSTMFSNAKVVRPVVQIPSTLLTTTCPVKQQLVLTATPTTSTRMSQSSRLTDNLISTSPMDASVSSSTLEQLREFDMVLEQVKERSTVQPNIQVSVSSPVSMPSNVSQGLLIPHSQSESSESSLHVSTSSFGQEVVFTTTVSPLTQRLNLTYMSQNLAKLAGSTPVVVVTNYQQAPSPALSVTSQSSSSPCVTPAPTTPNSSAGKTPPKVTSKSKSKSVKTNSTSTSKASPVPKPPQKPQEDEQTAQRIYDILAEYAEQLRNSPDLNNKPAPRRRSNPSANPGPNSKRKKSSSKRPSGQGTTNTSEMSPGTDDHHTMGSEDSSCGLVQISMQSSPSQGISSIEDCIHDTSSDVGGNVRSTQSDSSDGTATTTAEIRTQAPAPRHVIFADPNAPQQRNVIITETAVGEALAQVGKLGSSTAAVLVPGNYILPMSMVKGGQQITIVSGGSKILATVPARPGANTNALVLQGIINQAQKPILAQQSSPIKIPAIQTITGLSPSVPNNQTSVAQTLTSGSQLNQQVTYIESNTDKGLVTVNSMSASQGAIFLNSNSPTMNVVCASPSKVGASNVTGFISKSPAVVRTYSTITHTSGNNSNQKLSQTELVKIKNNFSVDENNELKINVVPDVPAIASSNNILTENAGRYTLSIASQAVLSQNIAQINTGASDAQSATLRTNKSASKESNNPSNQIIIPVQACNVGVTASLTTSNPVIKLVHSSSNNIENINENEVFQSSDISQEDRTHPILINTNNRIINGPLLSQATDHVYQSTTSVTNNSNDTTDCLDDNQIKNNVQKDNKIENGLIDQGGIFSKENTPWRYVPTSSNVEFLTMGDQIKFFRDNVETNCENICDKAGEDIDTKPFQSHLHSDIIKKRFANSMMCSSFGAKSDRLKTTARVSKELQQQTMERKQAALERELRLQKSLSEECEDLGVDEPSTSDLFPEADLLFDPSHSFDQNSQDATCSQAVGKNYSRGNFKHLDSSSDSTDADYVKNETDNGKLCNINEQNENYLIDQPSKMSADHINVSTEVSHRPANYIVHSIDGSKKETRLSDFDNNTEFMFNTTSFSRSVDESCMELVFENTDKNSNKNGKDECLHANHNSDSTSFGSSGEQTPTGTSPNLASHVSLSKSRNNMVYVNCKTKDTSSKINWESELEHSTTEDEMQFTEDDSSQSHLDNFQGINSNAEEPTTKVNKRKKVDALEGNGLSIDKNRKGDYMDLGKRKLLQSHQISHIDKFSSSPISPSDEHIDDSTKGSTRRLSLRGHVKKNCACCNGKAVVEAIPVAKKPRLKVDNVRAIKVNKRPAVSSKINKNMISKKR